MSHYASLIIGYGCALAAWFTLSRITSQLWPKEESTPRFDHPWREIAYALLAAICVILIGQLYTAGIRLPQVGPLGPLLESINQLCIFAPIPLLLIIRKHPPATAWLRADKLGWRILTGLILAQVALLAYTLTREGSAPWWSAAPEIYSYAQLDKAVQVFLEDLAIAVLIIRLQAALGTIIPILLTATLFAAGHIPTMIANGATLAELSSLTIDAALGVAVISAAIRSRDIWWLWCVHFAMDMTQFPQITTVGSGT